MILTVEAVPVRRDALVDPQTGRLPRPAREADEVGDVQDRLHHLR